MLLWPFNKYPGTDYETFNWEWILKTVKEWVATMQTFKNDITAAWDAMRADWLEYETSLTDDWQDYQDDMNDQWQEFIDNTYQEQITEILEQHPEWVTTVMDGAITKPKINAAFLREIENPFVTPEMYGAAGDNVADDTSAWEAAIASGKRIYAANEYKVTRTLYPDNDILMTGRVYTSASKGFVINSKQHHKYTLAIEYPYNVANTAEGVTVENCYNCIFNVFIGNFQYGLVEHGNNNGCAYNTFDHVYIANSEKFITIRATGSGGWCNENHHYNGRFSSETGSQYDGSEKGVTFERVNNTNQSNANSFKNFCMEQLYTAVDLVTARNNSFENIRTEGCTYAMTSDEISANNMMTVSYGPTTKNCMNPSNQVTSLTKIAEKNIDVLVASTGPLYGNTASNSTSATAPNAYSVVHNNAEIETQLYNLRSDVAGLRGKGSQSKIGFLVNTENNKTFRVHAITSGGPHRWLVVPFDENNAFVENAQIRGQFANYTATDSSAIYRHYEIQNDVQPEGDTTVLTINNSAVKKAYIGLLIQNANTIVHELNLYGDSSNYELYHQSDPTLSAIPTSDGYYIGQKVHIKNSVLDWTWNGETWS